MTDIVVVWQDDPGEDGKYNIRACGFTANGTKTFEYLLVNFDTSENQINPRVAMDEAGNFVVVWMDNRDGYYQIYMRGFYPDGTQRFAEAKVNDTGNHSHLEYPDIAMSRNGDFVVVWTACGVSHCVVCIRSFYADGRPRHNGLLVSNPNREEHQYSPAVGISPNGRYIVVVWASGPMFMDADGEYYSYGYLYVKGLLGDFEGYAYGSLHFSEFMVNPDDWGSYKHWPAIAVDESGMFAVTWCDSSSQIRARKYNYDGTEQSEDLIISAMNPTGHGGWRDHPRVAIEPLGGSIIVVWDEDEENNGYYQIRSKRCVGDSLYRQETVNSDYHGSQERPDIAMNLETCDYVVAWNEHRSDVPYGDHSYDVWGRRLEASAQGTSFADKRLTLVSGGQQQRPAIAMKLVESIASHLEECFIVTAAYGSPLDSHVSFLREFRDKRVKKSRIGALFVAAYEWIYYKFSPHVSIAMNRNPHFKKFMKYLVVNPIVYILTGFFQPLHTIRKFRRKAKKIKKWSREEKIQDRIAFLKRVIENFQDLEKKHDQLQRHDKAKTIKSRINFYRHELNELETQK